jgi:hypothetical protein
VTVDGWTDTGHATQLCQTAPNSSKAVARNAECHELLAQCLLQQVLTPHLLHLCFPFSTPASQAALGGAALCLLACEGCWKCCETWQHDLGNNLPDGCVRQVARASKDAAARTLGQRPVAVSVACTCYLSCLHNSQHHDS